MVTFRGGTDRRARRVSGGVGLADSIGPGSLARRTYVPGVEVQRADGALLRGDERAHVLLGPGDRSLRRLAQEGLVPVVGSRLIFVQGVNGRDAGQRDEREEEACRRPTGAHGSMRTRRHRFG